MPAFFGYTKYNIGKVEIIDKIIDEVYLILISYIVILFAYAIIYDSRNYTINKFIIKKNILGELFFCIALISFIYLYLYGNGSLLFTLEKKDLMNLVGHNLLIMEITASLAVIIFFIQKKFIFLLLTTILLILDVIIGFRFAIVITIVSIIYIYMNQKGKIQLIKYWKSVIIISFIGLFLIVSKEFIYGLKFGYSDYSLQQFSSIQFYLNALTRSEPFVIMAILNDVVKYNFHVNTDELFAFIKLVPFSETISNIEVISFNEEFQHVLFPQVMFGMANNILAQFISIGGYPLLFLYMIIYNIILYIGNLLLMAKNLKPIVIVVLILHAFYIFRNDLLYQITLEKKYIIIYFFINIFLYLMKYILRTKRKL
jgi:hypothetical protein